MRPTITIDLDEYNLLCEKARRVDDALKLLPKSKEDKGFIILEYGVVMPNVPYDIRDFDIPIIVHVDDAEKHLMEKFNKIKDFWEGALKSYREHIDNPRRKFWWK